MPENIDQAIKDQIKSILEYATIIQKVKNSTATKEELLLIINLKQYTDVLNEKLSEMKVQRQSELNNLVSALVSSKEKFASLKDFHKMDPPIHQLYVDIALRKTIPDQITKAV